MPSQVEESLRHDGAGPIPTFKNDDGVWDTRGHTDRVVRINRTALAAIHALTKDATSVEQARFLQPYSVKMLDVFRAMAAAPSLAEAVTDVRVTQNIADEVASEDVAGWQMSSLWHESGAQKEGVIRRQTGFRHSPVEMVISGPMFHVGNPFYKSPKAVCRAKSDYDVVDLTATPEDYLPRTNYTPTVEMSEYLRQLPRCHWDPTKSHVNSYRVAFRAMINLNSERSLIGALVPPGFAHVDTVGSICFHDPAKLITFNALSLSLIFDFLVKASSRARCFGSDVSNFPFFDVDDTAKHRGLRLACLTAAYADIWNEHAHLLHPLPWHSSDRRLSAEGADCPANWDRTAALRTDFARRMALVEIDVLVAQALGLTLDQLIDIYRIYFPVLQQYEAATWYDRNGRTVWTASKGLPGVGYLQDGKSPGRKRWEEILQSGKMQLECESVVDFLPGGRRKVTRVFEGPFDTCDRVEDYKRAWAYFAKRGQREAAA